MVFAEGGRMEEVVWTGKADRCQLCLKKLKDSFVEGVVLPDRYWTVMCIDCHAVYGNGLGTGKGQKYEKQGSKFVKVAG